MRILLVSDMHYRLPQYDWLYEVAPRFDAVVIAGDLLDISSAVAIPAQAAAVSAHMGRIGERGVVVAASGNHDLDERDANAEKTAGWLRRTRAPNLHVDGSAVVIGDTLFTVCGWWDGARSQVALSEQLARDAAARPARWVWIYHSPPTHSPLAWNGRREFGDDQVLSWINEFQPEFVLTGHIHQAPFVEGGGWADRIGPTWVFNAGQEPGPIPAHIVLDLDAGEAEWISSTERQVVSLR